MNVVVPSYRLVWYNEPQAFAQVDTLLFPVIAWYGIIGNEKSPCLLRSRGFFM